MRVSKCEKSECHQKEADGHLQSLPFRQKVWQLLEKWKYRLEKIVKPANRVECLEEDENADRIPRLFLKTWDKKKTANAQDYFITDT